MLFWSRSLLGMESMERTLGIAQSMPDMNLWGRSVL